MFVTIKDSDVDLLRVISRRSDQIVGKAVFPGVAPNVRYPDQVSGLFVNYLTQLHIRVMWWDLPESILALHVAFSTSSHIIAVSNKLRGVNEEWEQMRDVKPLVLHELAHIIREHPAAYVPPTKEDGTELARLQMLYDMIMHHAIASHEQFENEAEVFAAALGFWPGNLFWKQFAISKGEFRRVANYFKMPVDCAIKWALLSRPEHNIHYLKFNVGAHETEDYHMPAHYTPDEFPWDFASGRVADDANTAAGKCLLLKDDTSSATQSPSQHRAAAYWCYAFYERVEKSKARKDDKMLVGGFPKSLYDLLDSDESTPPSPS